jgi:hypothetical protein
MKDQLRAGVSAAGNRLLPALALIRAHHFWVVCAVVTFFGLLAAFSVGYASLSRTSVLESRVDELERTELGLDRWRTELQRPTAQESIVWRESERTLLGLGGDAGSALLVARLVAQRANEVGITGLHVRLLGPDSVQAIAPVQVGGWSVEPAGEGLAVEFDGNMGDVVGLLGALPPQAAVTGVLMAPRGDALHARIVLVTRRIALRE